MNFVTYIQTNTVYFH